MNLATRGHRTTAWRWRHDSTGRLEVEHRHGGSWEPAGLRSNSDGFRWAVCLRCDAAILVDKDSPELLR